MPAISSNTLFHFTKKDSLLGILKNEFYPRFCLEQYQVDETTSFKIGIPMVSFCDIPLSLVYSHMTRYGDYGIGMSMEWAERNKLNPVLYLRRNSHTTKVINDIFNSESKDIEKVGKNGIEVESLTQRYKMLLKLFAFTKPFELIKDNEVVAKCYDEREWRYVPDLFSCGSEKFILMENEYKDPVLSEENEKLKNAKLCFTPPDINYIIIKKESERSDLITEISRIKLRHPFDIIRVLVSKIISAEQIRQDF